MQGGTVVSNTDESHQLQSTGDMQAEEVHIQHVAENELDEQKVQNEIVKVLDVVNEHSSLAKIMPRKPLVVVYSLDLETSGLRVFVDRMTEIATCGAVIFSDASIYLLPCFQSYVECSVELRNKSKYITGITEETLANAPPLSNVLQRFSEYIAKTSSAYPATVPCVLAGHNLNKFDVPLLVAEVERCKFGTLKFFKQLRISFLFDTVIIIKNTVDMHYLLPRDKVGKACFKLEGIYERLVKKPLTGAHGALPDCKAVLELMLNYDCFKTQLLAGVRTKNEKYVSNFMTLIEETIHCIPKLSVNTSSKEPLSKKHKKITQYFNAVDKSEG